MQHLNEFEVAMLERIAEANPRYREQLRAVCESARIASRECSGAGGFFTFAPNDVVFEPANFELSPEAEISLPGLEHGMGAILFVRAGRVDWLEIFAYDEEWWGELRGFKIVPNKARGDAA